MKTFRILLFSALLFIFIHPGFTQEKYDTLPADYKRNVIKWNITPFVIWSSQNINFSYERAIKPYQSFSVNAGYFVLPTVGLFDSVRFNPTKKKYGFSISGDYRFYFKNRNTRNAPDGLYWGPYASYHYYQFQNTIEVTDNPSIQGSLALDGRFSVLSMGVQLGYQFVVKKNFTIDLIFMAPSVSLYSGKFNFDDDVVIDKEDEYLKAIRDILVSRFPFLDDLVEDGSFDTKGATSSFGPGLRYMIQVGYRF